MSLRTQFLSILLIFPCFGQQDYVLAEKDNIRISAPESERLNGKTFLIQADGFVILPTVGRIRGAGVTVRALEKELTEKLKQSIPSETKVAISVVNRHKITRALPDRAPVK